MRLTFIKMVIILIFFFVSSCNQNSELSVNDPLLNKIKIDQFDNIKIENLYAMGKIISEDNSDYYLEYGKMDYSYIRKTLSVVNDMIFLEVDSKKTIDLEELKKRMKQLNIHGTYEDEFYLSSLTEYIWAWRLKGNNKSPDFGCILTYNIETGKILIEWRQMTPEWFIGTVYYHRFANKLPLIDMTKIELIESFD